MSYIHFLAVCGMLSPIIYTLTWILGGFIVPGYSHIQKDVSSLFAVGSYRRWLFTTLFSVGIILLFAFSFGLFWGIEGNGSIVGPILFSISAFMGVCVSLFFPLDVGGKPDKWRGKMHVILVVASGILLIISMVFFWLGTREISGWVGFAWYSLVSVPISIVLIIITVKFTGSNYMGLFERIFVSYLELYYFVIALMLFINN